MVGSIAHHLSQHPELQQELRSRLVGPTNGDVTFMDAVIDEMLRIDNPFLSNRRKTTHATELGERCIEPDRRVYVD